MILVDSGFIVALVDNRDKFHAQAVKATSTITVNMITTEACLTEILYLAGTANGPVGHEKVWRMIEYGTLVVLRCASNGPLRAKNYMESFLDQPCDYADATLLLAAEDSKVRNILTFDSHFYAYRLHSGEHLIVVN